MDRAFFANYFLSTAHSLVLHHVDRRDAATCRIRLHLGEISTIASLCNDNAGDVGTRGAVQHVDIKIKRNARQWVRDLRASGWVEEVEVEVHRPGARTQCHSSGNLSEMGHYELKPASSRFFSPSPFAARHGKTRPVSRERSATRLASRESETG